MPTLIGRIETEHGAKYLTQLCKHFAHKIDATGRATTAAQTLPSAPRSWRPTRRA